MTVMKAILFKPAQSDPKWFLTFSAIKFSDNCKSEESQNKERYSKDGNAHFWKNQHQPFIV